MPNMKSLSLTVQKLQRKLKLTADRQAPNLLIRRHKNHVCLSGDIEIRDLTLDQGHHTP